MTSVIPDSAHTALPPSAATMRHAMWAIPAVTGVMIAADLRTDSVEDLLGGLRSAMEAGADAFLVKDAPAAQHAEAVKVARDKGRL